MLYLWLAHIRSLKPVATPALGGSRPKGAGRLGPQPCEGQAAGRAALQGGGGVLSIPQPARRPYAVPDPARCPPASLVAPPPAPTLPEARGRLPPLFEHNYGGDYPSLHSRAPAPVCPRLAPTRPQQRALPRPPGPTQPRRPCRPSRPMATLRLSTHYHTNPIGCWRWSAQQAARGGEGPAGVLHACAVYPRFAKHENWLGSVFPVLARYYRATTSALLAVAIRSRVAVGVTCVGRERH